VGESPNDRNDRAIRVAAAWYAARLPGMRVVMLTNDADNRRRALDAGLQAMSVQARAHWDASGRSPQEGHSALHSCMHSCMQKRAACCTLA